MFSKRTPTIWTEVIFPGIFFFVVCSLLFFWPILYAWFREG